MKNLNFLFALAVLVIIFACGGTSDEMDPPSAPLGERSMSFNNGPLIDIDSLDNGISNDYSKRPTIDAGFGAANYTTDETLGIGLFDEDPNSFPFTNNGVFPINNSLIRAQLRYINNQENKIFDATAGSVTITKFDRITNNSQILIQISGTFDVSDGTENLTGTFNNIRMRCLECE